MRDLGEQLLALLLAHGPCVLDRLQSSFPFASCPALSQLPLTPSPSNMMQAFVPSVSLHGQQALLYRRVPLCSLQASQPRTWQIAPSRVLGAVAGAIALVFSSGANFEALAKTKTATDTSKHLRYDGRQELGGREKAMSLTLTAGTFAALGVWAWKQNRKDDELENIRIKDEVERLEKLKAEFVDVDEDDEQLDDEDLMASLKQRLGEEEGGKAEGEEGEGEGGEKEEGAGGEDKEGEDKEVEGKEEEGWNEGENITSDSVDMLKRMWEATDDTRDKKP